MVVDTVPLDAHCVLGSYEPMDIDQWCEVNASFESDETVALACVAIMDLEADVLPVHGVWSGFRVPVLQSPTSMVADQLPSSSPPTATQLAPANPTMESEIPLTRVPLSPSPTGMVAKQVYSSTSSPHLAPPASTMSAGSRSATPPSPRQSPQDSNDDSDPAPIDQEEPSVQGRFSMDWARRFGRHTTATANAADRFVRQLAVQQPAMFAQFANPSAPLPVSEAIPETNQHIPVPTSLAEMLAQDGIPVSQAVETQADLDTEMHDVFSDDEFDEFADGLDLSIG
ncbi:hypothetical protein Unana1_01861 [Umbelopsis nana]